MSIIEHCWQATSITVEDNGLIFIIMKHVWPVVSNHYRLTVLACKSHNLGHMHLYTIFINDIQWLLTNLHQGNTWLSPQDWDRVTGMNHQMRQSSLLLLSERDQMLDKNKIVQNSPSYIYPHQNLPWFCIKMFTFRGRCLKFSRCKLFIRQVSGYLWQRTQNGAPVLCFSNDTSIQATHIGGIDLTAYRMYTEFW